MNASTVILLSLTKIQSAEKWYSKEVESVFFMFVYVMVLASCLLGKKATCSLS